MKKPKFKPWPPFNLPIEVRKYIKSNGAEDALEALAGVVQETFNLLQDNIEAVEALRKKQK